MKTKAPLMNIWLIDPRLRELRARKGASLYLALKRINAKTIKQTHATR